jgi:signal transduction histidine kinase
MAIDLYERSPEDRTKQEILQSLAELDSLVEEILLASRLDHVQKLEHAELVDLLALTAEEGAHSGVAVTGAAATISGDPRLLKRLVRNLMQNAQRHGAPPVTAGIEADGAIVRLRVRDHGQGIPDAERTRIFEPFYRPTGRSETAGSWGLGLSLVRQIAAHHGGTVRYEAEPAGGACFVVEFPAPASLQTARN